MNLGPYASLAWPAIALVAGLIIGFAVERIVLPRWPPLKALKNGVTLLFGIIATWIAVDILRLPGENARHADQFLLLITVAVVTWFVARLAALTMHGYARAHPAMLSSASLFASIGRAAIISIGVLIALSSVGISIAPVLAALGVGGLAVGLALQPTLANLFAGMQILAAGIMRPGDFVRLATGLEGTIVDITWHSTVMRDAVGALVIVPNTTLSTSQVINMSSHGIRLTVPFLAGVSADLGEVSAVVLEATHAHVREYEVRLVGEPYLVFAQPDANTVACTLCVHVTGTTPPFELRSALFRIVREALAEKGIPPFGQPK